MVTKTEVDLGDAHLPAHQILLDGVNVGKTLECLFSYYTDEEEPNFVVQMKQLVRRTKVCGVGYMWLSF